MMSIQVTDLCFDEFMTEPSESSYPGSHSTPDALIRLADEFRDAAKVIEKLGRPGDPVSRAPFRLNAIHAIELYLNALLLHAGHESGLVRGLQHDLAIRADLASQVGLLLRQRTLAHLHTLASTREYLLSRYAPEAHRTLSQLNRLSATLDEVATKVTAIVREDCPKRVSA